MAAYLVYGLVFAAVFMAAAVMYQTFVAFGRAKGDTLAAADKNAALEGFMNPMDRFVSSARLFRLRMAFCLAPGFLVPFAFWVAGLSNALLLAGMAALLGWTGWMCPLWYFTWKVRRRQMAYESKVLDLTMGVANGMKAGMALPQALERVASQMGGVMQEELAITLREYRLGMDLVEALGRLHDRMPCEDMRLLTSAIKLATQAGGSLVEVLVEMVSMIRGRTEFQEKLKTLTAQGRFEAIAMSATPLFAFAILYFMNPDLMRPLVTTVTGWLAIGATLTLEIVGFLFIRKIVTIEV